MSNRSGTTNVALLTRLMAMNAAQLSDWVRVEVTAYLDARSGPYAGMPDRVFWPIYAAAMRQERNERR